MRKPLIYASILATALIGLPAANAQQATIHDVFFQPIASPDHATEAVSPTGGRELRSTADSLRTVSNADNVTDFEFYPVAGILGRDLLIPYFVDLQPGSGVRDFNCTQFTFEEHNGHDPYIRSFREMDIGVPVFAAQDGVISDVHDGEDDHNTDNSPDKKANYVIIKHSDSQQSQYFHLKKGSISVKVGDTVTAGTQIALVGSSGMSKGPHIHFEADFNRVAYEPLAGPCRPGKSNFETQPAMTLDPIVMGAALGTTSFAGFRAAPFDDAPRTGTFIRGVQRIYIKMEIASVPPNSQYNITMLPPNGIPFPAGSGRLAGYEVDLASFGFGMDVDLYTAGNWTLVMQIAGREVMRLPFTVVNTQAELVNHAPNPVSPSLEPVGVRSNEVAVCRALGSDFADPDFDIVSYHYVWSVDGTVVRDVTTAARSDALARQFVRPGGNLSCAISASDGKLSTQTMTTHADVSEAPRRRAAARR